MTWTTLRIIKTRWEAELMQQMLLAHGIPSRLISKGIMQPFVCDTLIALQVRLQDQWTALLLLSPVDESVPEASE